MPVENLNSNETIQYVAVAFTAQYCPPCEGFYEPLKKFYDEASKDGRFELIMVNCDRRELEYADQLQKLDGYLTVPFDATEVVEKLEDAANANTLPRLAIFSVEKGFDKPVVENLNNVINKWESNGKMADVEQRIQSGIENFDVVPAEESENLGA